MTGEGARFGMKCLWGEMSDETGCDDHLETCVLRVLKDLEAWQ